MNAELRRLMDEALPEPVRPDDKTVGWAAARMLDSLVKPEPQTIDGYRRDWKNHLQERFGDKPLDRVESEDVERLVKEMLGAGKAPKTIQNVVRLLGQIFNHSRKKKWTKHNPVEGVELPKPEATGPDDAVPHLDQPEVPKLMEAVKSDSEFAAVDRALYLTATMTGLRQGELLALRWKDVDWKAGKIRVRLNRTREHGDRSPKSKASRREPPMPDAVGGILDRLFQASKFQGDDARVFGHPISGDALDHTKLDRRFKAAVKASKVKPITFHGLRHTFGTQCARAGVPMRTLQKWMGHRRISTTEIYAAYAEDQQEAQMVEAAFTQLSKNVPQFLPQSERSR